MIGKTISHYKISEKLGQGAMGVVYKAQDCKLKRTVALKFLPSHLVEDAQAKVRFIHEAQATAALQHPNIANTYDYIESAEETVIVMEYLDGETLAEKIERQEANLEHILDWTIGIAEGLAAAHKKGITHRDVKPENIMITNTGEAKILDFGVAKLRGTPTLTEPGSRIGTLDYAAPELVMGGTGDHRSDIFSLGVVLYELLTGQRPFQAEHDAAVVYAIVNEAPKPLDYFCKDVPPPLARLIMKMLEKSKEKRYPSFDQLLADLQELKRTMTTGPVIPVGKRKAQKSNQQKLKLQFLTREFNSKQIKERLISTKIVGRTHSYLYLYGGVVILLILLAMAGLQWFSVRTESVDSIAVLPLENLSGDPEQDYFADGMTEELISTLSKIGGLRVIAPTSVMQYKGAARNPAEIGRELNVGTVLEGSVRKAGNVLRITVQLIHTQSQEPLWSHDYDRKMENVFAIQTHITQHVAEAMKVRLIADEKRQVEKKPTENLEAYFLYLRGHHQWSKRTVEGFKKGFGYFKQAIELDPNYARAYAGLADSYTWFGTYHIIPEKEAFPRAKAAAIRALEIDAKLAEAHTSLAIILRNYDWNWPEAEREFKRAIELNPNYAGAHIHYAVYLTAMGRFDEAIAEANRALELDPLSSVVSGNLGIIFYWARQYDQAIEQLRQTIAMRPDILPVPLILNLNLAYVQKGMVEEAISELKKARTRSPNNPDLAAHLAYAYGMAGKRREAQQVLDEFKEIVNEEHVLFNLSAPLNLALIHIGLGEKDQAFEWLERAYADRAWLMMTLNTEPYFDPLRSDPRFTALLKKMGLE